MPKDTTPSIHTLAPAAVRKVLRREFTIFFTRMRTEEPGWPAIPDQQFVDAIADSLVETSKLTGREPVAYLQTLIHELQDRVNNITKG